MTSTNSFQRPRLLAACVAVSSVLVACSPPGEQDSAHKVQTATHATALPFALSTGTHNAGRAHISSLIDAAASSPTPSRSKPGMIDCLNPPSVKPQFFHVSCSDDSQMVTQISWKSWSDSSAEGTGLLNGRTVDIVFSQPSETTFGWIFSRITIDGSPLLAYQLNTP
ncbi:hypothetical protein P4N68_07035 [Corynebacterium felinum]|nr:hypothetical protein [Corynebacterium felinum]